MEEGGRRREGGRREERMVGNERVEWRKVEESDGRRVEKYTWKGGGGKGGKVYIVRVK